MYRWSDRQRRRLIRAMDADGLSLDAVLRRRHKMRLPSACGEIRREADRLGLVGDPPPDELARRCAAVRQGWTDQRGGPQISQYAEPVEFDFGNLLD